MDASPTNEKAPRARQGSFRKLITMEDYQNLSRLSNNSGAAVTPRIDSNQKTPAGDLE